jgi:hypothetical protein
MSDANTQENPSKVLSLEELEEMWTPDRTGRATANEMNVHQFAGPAKQLSDGETYDIKHFTVKIVPKNDDQIYDMAQVSVRVVTQK